ncbi:hypothetical protein ES703_20864 [subsurface metagenome]
MVPPAVPQGSRPTNRAQLTAGIGDGKLKLVLAGRAELTQTRLQPMAVGNALEEDMLSAIVGVP